MTEKHEENSILKGMKKASMIKEAIASVELDRGQTHSVEAEKQLCENCGYNEYALNVRGDIVCKKCRKKFKTKTSLDKKSKGCGKKITGFAKCGDTLGHPENGVFWQCDDCKAKNHSPTEAEKLDEMPDYETTSQDTPSVALAETHLERAETQPVADTEGTSNLSDELMDVTGNGILWVREDKVKEFIRRYIGIINRQQGDLSKIKLIKSLKKLTGKTLSGDL